LPHANSTHFTEQLNHPVPEVFACHTIEPKVDTIVNQQEQIKHKIDQKLFKVNFRSMHGAVIEISVDLCCKVRKCQQHKGHTDCYQADGDLYHVKVCVGTCHATLRSM